MVKLVLDGKERPTKPPIIRDQHYIDLLNELEQIQAPPISSENIQKPGGYGKNNKFVLNTNSSYKGGPRLRCSSENLRIKSIETIRKINKPVKNELNQFFKHEAKQEMPVFGYPHISFNRAACQSQQVAKDVHCTLNFEG